MMFKHPVLIKLAKIAVGIFLLIFLLDNYTSINLRTIIASIGILGLGISIAAGDIFKNVLGGIFLAIDRPFKVKDQIKISDYEGQVSEINLRSTVIFHEKGTTTLPNKMMSDNAITRLHGWKKS